MTSEGFQRRMDALYRRIDKLREEPDGVVRHSDELIELNKRVRDARRAFRDETSRMENAPLN